MKTKMHLLYLSIILILSPLVSALGMSTPYYVGNPLPVYPGETTQFDVSAMGSDSENITFIAGISSGSDIAQIVDLKDSYSFPAGQQYPLTIRVKIPNNAAIGTEYTIMAYVTQTGSSNENTGLVAMGTGVQRIIPVVVKTREEVLGIAPPVVVQKSNTGLYLTVGIIILLLLIIGLYLWRKNNNKPVQTTAQQAQTPQVNQPKP